MKQGYGWSAIALAVLGLGVSVPAAAATDYLLKLDGVTGETKAKPGIDPDEIDARATAAKPGVEPDEIDARATAAATAGKGHDKWTELTSLRLVEEDAAAGGVNVAVGDVTGDGRADAAGHHHHHQPIHMRKRIEAGAAPAAPAGPDAVSSGGEQTAALLLPAVQKVREAAARMPAWEGCAVGQKLAGVRIMEKASGRTGRILDPVVSACAAEQVSFNFTKIEWD